MTDLSTIATELQLPPEQLRVAVELLSQGYQPPFISSFRADESGNLPEKTLWQLKGIIERQSALFTAQKKALEELDRSTQVIPGLDKAVQEARSSREIDRLLRPLHSKKNSFSFAERHPQAAKILAALQANDAPAVENLHAWVVDKFGIEAAQVEAILGQVRHLIVLKLSENPTLLTKLRRQITRKALLVAELIKDEGGASPKVESETSASNSAASIAAAVAAEQHEEHKLPEVANVGDDLAEDLLPPLDEEHDHESEAETAAATATEPNVSSGEDATADKVETTEAKTPSTGATAIPAEKGKKGKAEVRLTPRQRRRRWLQSMLQPYDGLKKPLNKLSSYQVVMLARGQRTQLIKTSLDYDRAGLVLMATESIVPAQHPLTSWMDEVASEALGRVVLPRIEQDVLAELEDQAHEKLLLQAGDHFATFVTQRPLRGHRILCIDAVGPKMAPLAIVCPKGNVLAIDEVPCQGGKAENKSAVVTKIGELVHKHRVSLIVLSNGPARRSLMPALAELLEQSTPGSVRFSLIDRTGADAYATTKIASDELGRFSRRHRSAAWLARRIQDSRHEVMKIDVARLRLGSYQGELSTDRLRSALNEVASATMASDGIDVWHASEIALQRIPGVTPDIAAAIVELREKGELSSRAQLLESLADQWPAQQSRQAIGFLRIYNSTNPLDGTTIHPDDYHLATRLATALGISLPPGQPEGWMPPARSSAAALLAADAVTPATSPEEESQSDSVLPSSETAVSEPTSDAGSDVSSVAETTEIGDPAAPPVAETPATESTVAEVTAGSALASEAGDSMQPETEAAPVAVVNQVDVEKYAKSWQVGREKLKRISRILQAPFEDRRLSQPLIPLWTKVPKLDDLQPGMSLWGVIVGLADFGAFADLGIDCQGLIHVSRLAPGYVEDPHQFVQIGDLIRVWVVSIDREKKRISLSAIVPGTETAQARPGRGDGQGDRSQSERGQGNRGQGWRGQGSREQGQREQGQRDPAQRPPRGGQAGDNRGGGPRGTGPRSSGPRDGNREGGNRGSAPRNDGYRGGGRGRGQGRPRQADETTAVEAEELRQAMKPKVDRSSKPAAKLTEAMQKGREPLRSFSDLMQFYQTQKDPQPSAVPPTIAPPSGDSGSENGETITNSPE
jgi:transcriptional accessory protein Tex/SPT6